jgi:hypothetical protein
MPVVNVGEMGVPMRDRLMRVSMSMRLVGAYPVFMLVLVVIVMQMAQE